jgi:hypothetical protein
MVNFITSFAVILAAASSALAAPQPLEARDDTSCMDNLPGNTLANVCLTLINSSLEQNANFPKVNEAVECINYLASLGDQACVAGVSGQSFCRRGNTQITGLAVGLNSDQTSSSPW